MFTDEQHVDNLVRHIELVHKAGLLLAKRVMAQGRKEFGRNLLGKIYQHDVSKFGGIEWDYLHVGKDVDKEKLKLAIKQHQSVNSHHPECHGGIENMGEMDVAEMVCDWYARAQEFGTGLREWIKDKAIPNFKIKLDSQQHQWIKTFVDIILESAFS